MRFPGSPKPPPRHRKTQRHTTIQVPYVANVQEGFVSLLVTNARNVSLKGYAARSQRETQIETVS